MNPFRFNTGLAAFACGIFAISQAPGQRPNAFRLGMP